MSDWHGVAIIDRLTGAKAALHVGPVPGRKSLALYVFRAEPGKGAWSYPLAYFRSEEAAREALAFIDKLAEAAPARSNAPTTDEPAPIQAEIPAEGDRGSQGRSGGREEA